jgi:hypothetical protein
LCVNEEQRKQLALEHKLQTGAITQFEYMAQQQVMVIVVGWLSEVVQSSRVESSSVRWFAVVLHVF